MKSYAPCLLVCIVAALGAVYCAVALATMPSSRGGEAVVLKTTKAPRIPAIRDPWGVHPPKHGEWSRGVTVIATARGGLAS